MQRDTQDNFIDYFVSRLPDNDAGRVEDFVIAQIDDGNILNSETPEEAFSRHLTSLSYQYGLSEHIEKGTSDREDIQDIGCRLPSSGYASMVNNVRRGS